MLFYGVFLLSRNIILEPPQYILMGTLSLSLSDDDDDT
jgi:hypothetical protein